MSILYAISIVYIAGEYCDPPCCTPIIGASLKEDGTWYSLYCEFIEYIHK